MGSKGGALGGVRGGAPTLPYRGKLWQRAAWRPCSVAPASSAATSCSGWRPAAMWCGWRAAIRWPRNSWPRRSGRASGADLCADHAGGAGRARGPGRERSGEPGRHPGRAPRGRLPAHPRLCGGRAGAGGRRGGGGAAGACLGDRGRSGEPQRLWTQQGGRRTGGAGGVSRCDHPAPVGGVRAEDQFFNRFGRHGADARR